MNDCMCDLSIIIPVYNVERYLLLCLDSILHQSSPSWECILVDDGSSDDSGKVCDEFAEIDSRFRVFHKKNGGVSSARNLGISKASARYISFVDADDRVSKDYVSKIVYGMQSTDLLFFAHSAVKEGDYVTTYQRSPFRVEGKKQIEKHVLKLKRTRQGVEVFSFTWNKAFKRKIIVDNRISFLEGLSTREDEVFTNQYCHYIESMSYIDDAIYLYTIVDSGLTARKKTFNDLKTLSYALDQSTDWCNNSVLKGHVKARSLYFGLEAAFLCLVPSVFYFTALFRYAKKYRVLCCYDTKSRMIFNHNIFISFFLFYTIVPLVHILRSLKR